MFICYIKERQEVYQHDNMAKLYKAMRSLAREHEQINERITLQFWELCEPWDGLLEPLGAPHFEMR